MLSNNWERRVWKFLGRRMESEGAGQGGNAQEKAWGKSQVLKLCPAQALKRFPSGAAEGDTNAVDRVFLRAAAAAGGCALGGSTDLWCHGPQTRFCLQGDPRGQRPPLQRGSLPAPSPRTRRCPGSSPTSERRLVPGTCSAGPRVPAGEKKPGKKPEWIPAFCGAGVEAGDCVICRGWRAAEERGQLRPFPGAAAAGGWLGAKEKVEQQLPGPGGAAGAELGSPEFRIPSPAFEALLGRGRAGARPRFGLEVSPTRGPESPSFQQPPQKQTQDSGRCHQRGGESSAAPDGTGRSGGVRQGHVVRGAGPLRGAGGLTAPRNAALRAHQLQTCALRHPCLQHPTRSAAGGSAPSTQSPRNSAVPGGTRRADH